MSQTALAIGDVQERKITRLIEVRLQPAELGELGKEAGHLSGQIGSTKSEYDAIKSTWSAKIKKMAAELDEILKKLEMQVESREEECTEKRIFATNTLQVWHGEDLVEERALTEDERQEDMFTPPEVLPPETEESSPSDIKDVINEEQNPMKPTAMN